jgi:hypothetical protein
MGSGGCGYWWDEWKGCLAFTAIAVGVGLFAVLLAAYGFVLHIDVSVEEASLTRFDLVTSPVTAFTYNPNWAMSLKNTKQLEAAYKFDDQQFDRVHIAEKGDKHPPGKTRVYHLVSNSNTTFVALGSTVSNSNTNRKENSTGVFQVEEAVTGEVRYTGRYIMCKIEASCLLKLQLALPGTEAVVFQKIKCKLADPEKNC